MDTLTLVYFSPTHTTRTVLQNIAQGMGKEIGNVIDLTRSANRAKLKDIKIDDGPVLIGAPVYGGRLPKDAAESLKDLKANGNPAIVTVLYGNREFEDALLELKDIAVNAGCKPVAAAAFIGEHSFSISGSDHEIAAGRPDPVDLEKAKAFGKDVQALLDNGYSGQVDVPGNFPYKEVKMGPVDFIAVSDDCNDCGTCETVCPKDAIDPENHHATDIEACIRCCACIKACPQDARTIKAGPVMDATKWLFDNCSARKEPELFLAGN